MSWVGITNQKWMPLRSERKWDGKMIYHTSRMGKLSRMVLIIITLKLGGTEHSLKQEKGKKKKHREGMRL